MQHVSILHKYIYIGIILMYMMPVGWGASWKNASSGLPPQTSPNLVLYKSSVAVCTRCAT